MNFGKIFLISFCCILNFAPHSDASEASPRVPYIQHDICPFECCQFGKWTARTDLTVYRKEGDDTVVSFVIKSGEQFTAVRGNVYIIRAGEFVLRQSFKDFKRGEKLYILSYHGEGLYDLWSKGKVFSSFDEIWSQGELVKTPEMIWWVFIKDIHGKEGWLRLKNVSESGFLLEESIEGMDSCS